MAYFHRRGRLVLHTVPEASRTSESGSTSTSNWTTFSQPPGARWTQSHDRTVSTDSTRPLLTLGATFNLNTPVMSVPQSLVIVHASPDSVLFIDKEKQESSDPAEKENLSSIDNIQGPVVSVQRPPAHTMARPIQQNPRVVERTSSQRISGFVRGPRAMRRPSNASTSSSTSSSSTASARTEASGLEPQSSLPSITSPLSHSTTSTTSTTFPTIIRPMTFASPSALSPSSPVNPPVVSHAVPVPAPAPATSVKDASPSIRVTTSPDPAPVAAQGLSRKSERPQPTSAAYPAHLSKQQIRMADNLVQSLSRLLAPPRLDIPRIEIIPATATATPATPYSTIAQTGHPDRNVAASYQITPRREGDVEPIRALLPVRLQPQIAATPVDLEVQGPIVPALRPIRPLQPQKVRRSVPPTLSVLALAPAIKRANARGESRRRRVAAARELDEQLASGSATETEDTVDEPRRKRTSVRPPSPELIITRLGAVPQDPSPPIAVDKPASTSANSRSWTVVGPAHQRRRSVRFTLPRVNEDEELSTRPLPSSAPATSTFFTDLRADQPSEPPSLRPPSVLLPRPPSARNLPVLRVNTALRGGKPLHPFHPAEDVGTESHSGPFAGARPPLKINTALRKAVKQREGRHSKDVGEGASGA